MSKSYLIWNYEKLEFWKLSGKNSKLLLQGIIDENNSLKDFLDQLEKKFRIVRFSVLIDHPKLDHRIERVPNIKRKLQEALLIQRKKKFYGDELRSWSSFLVKHKESSKNTFFIIASLAKSPLEPLVSWALNKGVYLEGVFSLSLFISIFVSKKKADIESNEKILVSEFFGNKYLIALDKNNHLLFFSRVRNAVNNSIILDEANKLKLFIEQEYGLVPKLNLDSNTDILQESNKDIFKSLGKFKFPKNQNLILKEDSKKQILRRVRVRLFCFLIIIVFLLSIRIIPQIGYKKQISNQVDNLKIENYSKDLKIAKLENLLNQRKVYDEFIDFASLNKKISSSLLFSITKALSDSLPDSIILDSMDIELDLDNDEVHIKLLMRPLSFSYDILKNYNRLNIISTNIEFTKQQSNLELQDGANRQFLLELMLKPKL